MEEDVILNDTNVTITRSRLIMSGKTYVLKNISSVELATIPANNSPFFAVAIFGMLAFWIADGTLKWLGLAATVGAVIGMVKNPANYSVRLNSTSGEVDGFKSTDRQYILRVVEAINHAIVVM